LPEHGYSIVKVAGLSRGGDTPHLAGTHLELTDEEAAALARHLRDALDYARYPFAPRLDPLKAILDKLDPPAPRPEPLPDLRIGMAWSHPVIRRQRIT
jgi:hypothetical protein